MSINKDLLDQLMEGRTPGDLFGKGGIIQELTKALAERALRSSSSPKTPKEGAISRIRRPLPRPSRGCGFALAPQLRPRHRSPIVRTIPPSE